MGNVQSTPKHNFYLTKVSNTNLPLVPFIHTIVGFNGSSIKDIDPHSLREVLKTQDLSLEVLDIILSKKFKITIPRMEESTGKLGINIIKLREIPSALKIKVTAVKESSKSKLQIGDHIIGIENMYIENENDLFLEIGSNENTRLVVLRDNAVIIVETEGKELGCEIGSGLLFSIPEREYYIEGYTGLIKKEEIKVEYISKDDMNELKSSVIENTKGSRNMNNENNESVLDKPITENINNSENNREVNEANKDIEENNKESKDMDNLNANNGNNDIDNIGDMNNINNDNNNIDEGNDDIINMDNNLNNNVDNLNNSNMNNIDSDIINMDNNINNNVNNDNINMNNNLKNNINDVTNNNIDNDVINMDNNLNNINISKDIANISINTPILSDTHLPALKSVGSLADNDNNNINISNDNINKNNPVVSDTHLPALKSVGSLANNDNISDPTHIMPIKPIPGKPGLNIANKDKTASYVYKSPRENNKVSTGQSNIDRIYDEAGVTQENIFFKGTNSNNTEHSNIINTTAVCKENFTGKNEDIKMKDEVFEERKNEKQVFSKIFEEDDESLPFEKKENDSKEI